MLTMLSAFLVRSPDDTVGSPFLCAQLCILRSLSVLTVYVALRLLISERHCIHHTLLIHVLHNACLQLLLPHTAFWWTFPYACSLGNLFWGLFCNIYTGMGWLGHKVNICLTWLSSPSWSTKDILSSYPQLLASSNFPIFTLFNFILILVLGNSTNYCWVLYYTPATLHNFIL